MVALQVLWHMIISVVIFLLVSCMGEVVVNDMEGCNCPALHCSEGPDAQTFIYIIGPIFYLIGKVFGDIT